jgi:hypothetical protein
MRFLIVLSAVLALSACGAKPKPAAEMGADSAAALPAPSGETAGALDSATRDSLAPTTDSAAPKATSVTPTTTDAKSAASAKAPSKIIGRDSAFGPIGEVDASGKITPIPTKKP